MASHPFLSLLVPYFIVCMHVYLNFTYVKHWKNKDLTISGDIKSLNIMDIFVLYIYIYMHLGNKRQSLDFTVQIQEEIL